MSSQDGTSQNMATPSQENLLLYVYNGRRVVSTRQATYSATIEHCRALFSRIPHNHEISISTTDLELYNGQPTEVSSESWPIVNGQIKTITVVSRLPGNDTIVLHFIYESRQVSVKTTLQKPVEVVIDNVNIALNPGGCKGDLRLTYEGRRLAASYATVADWNVVNSATIHCVKALLGGKPVIYLFSPTPLDASVRLSLVPEWEISAIYPVVPIKAATQNANQQVSWSVKVNPNGELTELMTGLDVAYLFWEAHTNAKRLDSPPLSPVVVASPAVQTGETFVPNDAVLTDENAVLVPTNNITPYLDASLKALGLRTEARTSFITYWLPSLLKHKHIALRFLPQMAYEKSAPLEISPTPDVVTRIFMLFRGVRDEDRLAWSSAEVLGLADVSFWAQYVGVDVPKTLDTQLYRVIEWGGMELPP